MALINEFELDISLKKRLKMKISILEVLKILRGEMRKRHKSIIKCLSSLSPLKCYKKWVGVGKHK